MVNGQAMYTEHMKEQKELIMAVPKNRKLSDLPKIPQVHFSSLYFFFWVI